MLLKLESGESESAMQKYAIESESADFLAGLPSLIYSATQLREERDT